MRLASMFGTGFVPIACLAVCLDVSAASPAAARGLIGSSRASFMKSTVEGCIENLAAEADFAGVPKNTLVSICRCTATHIADHVMPAQLDEPDTPEMRAIIAEATSACLVRHRHKVGDAAGSTAGGGVQRTDRRRRSLASGTRDPAEPRPAGRRSV